MQTRLVVDIVPAGIQSSGNQRNGTSYIRIPFLSEIFFVWTMDCDYVLNLFPGPVQLLLVLQTTESWAGPGNKLLCTSVQRA